MSLFWQLMVGAMMLGITAVFHAMALDYIIRKAGKVEKHLRRWPFWKPLAASGVILSVFLSHVVQIWMWVALYLQCGCSPLNGLADALYFATVTYTTLGYGDITLDPSCRMLSGIEAANGFIMFGWTTAFIFEVISNLYRQESQEL
jgi:hypothetical protein